MASFKNFANGGIEDGNSQEYSSVRHKQVREPKGSNRVEKVWAADFEQCKSREDFEMYISKYSRYGTNKYVAQAKSRIVDLDAAERAKTERKRATQRKQSPSRSQDIGSGAIPPNNNILKTLMKVAVWIVIIGGVGLYSYNEYKKNEQIESTEKVVVKPRPAQDQDSRDNATTHTHSEQIHEQEHSVVEPEPQEFWWDCTCCGATGRCQLCFGSGRCGVCGGGGSLYRSSGWISCDNCGGTGGCPACQGSGVCFACHGLGKCKLEQ